MKRSSRAGGRSKPRRRKRSAPSRRSALRATRGRGPSIAGQETIIGRLTRERDEALQQQRAAADVLRVISRSSGHLEQVLDMLVETVARLCRADHALMFRRRDDVYSLVAVRGLSHEAKEFFLANPFAPGPGTLAGRVALERRVIHLTDVLRDPKYTHSAPKITGARTALGIPLLRDDALIGIFVAARTRVCAFTTNEIELATTFADQAIIAIENAWLFERLARSNMMLRRERENKLMNINAATSSVVHEVRQPLAAITTNSAAARRWLERVPPDVDRVKKLLEQIERAGFHANAVLTNVRRLFEDAEHELQPIDVNNLALETLQTLDGELNDHGVKTDVELVSELPLIMGHRVQLQEVISNLVHNAIDAMAPIKVDRRTLKMRTKPDGGKTIIIEVEDSGHGIEPERLGSIFEAFVTTKPNGTGLGLAICKTIIERHGGRLTALSDGKNGALFQIVLPVEPKVTDTSRLE
jgi:signal transduction histidine kinase